MMKRSISELRQKILTLKARQQQETQEESVDHGNQGKMCGENMEEGNAFKCCCASFPGPRSRQVEPLPVERQGWRPTARVEGCTGIERQQAGEAK